MEEKNTDTGFKYTYSAIEQDEIKRIRQKYQVQEEDGMSKLRKMDAQVSQKATVVSLVLGVIGTLIMGSGMSLIMTDIGSILGIADPMMPGIIVGVIGLVMAIITYPVYKKILNSRKKKYADEIIKLSDNIMSNNK